MKRTTLFGAALLFAPCLAFGAPSSGQHAPSVVQMPPKVSLVGESEVDEIRQFPELQRQGTNKMEKEKTVGVAAIDRVYSTRQDYNDTVGFFDRQFGQTGYQTLARTVTPSATAWSVRRPDGGVANAIVRNTSPTTIETIEAVSATLDRNAH